MRMASHGGMKELQQVLPEHSRSQLQDLYREPRTEERIVCIGKTASARWFPHDGIKWQNHQLALKLATKLQLVASECT